MTSPIDDHSQFVRLQVAADALSASRTRVEFRNWLDRHFTLGPDQFSDLVLAVGEALANAAEFAYADPAQRGTMDVRATYDAASDSLAVIVHDHGQWRPIAANPRRVDSRFSVRGRGIPLMRALADEASINGTPQGTRITLTWNRLTRPA